MKPNKQTKPQWQGIVIIISHNTANSIHALRNAIESLGVDFSLLESS